MTAISSCLIGNARRLWGGRKKRRRAELAAFLGSIGPGIDGQFFDVFCLADRVHIQRIACNVHPDREHPIFRFRGLPPSCADLVDAASWAFGGNGEVWVFLSGLSFVGFERDIGINHQVCDEAFICVVRGEKCSCNAHGLVPFVWRLRPLKSRAESDDHQRPASPPCGVDRNSERFGAVASINCQSWKEFGCEPFGVPLLGQNIGFRPRFLCELISPCTKQQKSPPF